MSFDPYKTKFQIDAAIWMARLADAVYTKVEEGTKPDEETIKKNLVNVPNLGRGVKKVFGYDKNSAQGMIVSHSTHIAVVFRGTDEWRDWLDNIDALRTKHLFGDFHQGFVASTLDIWKEMNNQIKTLQKQQRRPVWFAGHSLGGAMATVAAANFIYDDRPFYGAYTFGQPRCMDRDSSRIFNAEAKGLFYRFQNNNDLVSRIPARVMGYSHVGQCIYISEEKKLYSSPSWWFKFLDKLDGAVTAIKEKGFDGLEDHDIVDYVMAIEDWKDSGNNLPLDD